MQLFQDVSLSEEFRCPVCLETMNVVATLMPCLHKLCMADAARVSSCPVCRQRVERFAKDHTMTMLAADALAKDLVRCTECGSVMGRAVSQTHACSLVVRLEQLAPHLSQAALRSIVTGWDSTLSTMDDLVDTVLSEEARATLPAARRPPAHVPSATVPGDASRASGTLLFWKADQRSHMYGFVKLDSGESVFVHSNAIVHGVPHAGAQLSFRVEPSPKDASKRQACDAVVLQPGESLGVIVRWPLRDKNKALYGFVRPYCSGYAPFYAVQAGADSAYFSASGLTESSLRVGSEAVFTLQVSPSRPGTQQATGLRPLERDVVVATAAPAAAATPTTLPDNTTPQRTAVHLLWDFDQTFQWTQQRVTTTYLNILERLVRDGYALRKSQVHGRAFGTMRVLADPTITKALADLQVDVQLVSHLKKEETDKHLERAAQTILDAASLSATTKHYMVLISSDKDFTSIVRRLEQNNVCVLLIHDAAPGSSHEAVLSVYPTRTYRLSEFEGPASAVQPPLAPRAPANAASTRATAAGEVPVRHNVGPRHLGKLHYWTTDSNQQSYGFVKLDESGATVFVHAASVVHGTPLTNAMVSFQIQPSPKDPSKLQAIDTVVLMPGQHVGRVSRWPLLDKHQRPYGFLDVPGSALGVYFSGNDVEGALDVGCEVVCLVTNSPSSKASERPGAMQASNVRPLTKRSPSAAIARHQV